MPLPVSLDLVAQELDSLMDLMSAFVNRKTGEIVIVSDEELGLVEEWYQFKHEALKTIAREALEELGVPYK